MKFTRMLSVLTTVGILFMLSLPAHADLAPTYSPPWPLVTVYFEIDGEPYDEPVDFRITCYGYYFSDDPFPAFPNNPDRARGIEEVYSW